MQKRIWLIILGFFLAAATMAGCGTGGQGKVAGNATSKEGINATTKIQYPVKAVTVVHGFKPGGGSDQLSQLVQPFLEKILKQQFVNEYKPGASGAIACKEVMLSKPDGYTLTTLMAPTTILTALINPNAGYSMDGFVPIANIIFDPGVLLVSPDSKFQTIQDLLDYARKNPGQLKLADNGIGGDDWYNTTMIEKIAGLKFNHIPFEGDGPACQAAAGGHVDAASSNISIAAPLIKGGKLKALAVYTEERLSLIPETPTLKESGIDFVEGSYRGYMAPKGTPQEIIDILADGMEKVINDPTFKKACDDVNLQIKFMRGDAYKSFVDNKVKVLQQVVAEIKK
ncbi:MAG: tripartite tricarboxylate transporter substrate binding protein [Moorella sp. (in: firmicutes)]